MRFTISIIVCAQFLYIASASASEISSPPINTPQLLTRPLGTLNPQTFFNAIDAGDITGVKSQLDFAQALHQANLEFIDQGGNTPLIRAAILKKPDIMNFLIHNGANVNAVNLKGQSALTISYNYGDYDEAKYILSRGAADPYNVSGFLHQIDEQAFHQLEAEKAATAAHAEIVSDIEIGGALAAIAGGAAVAAGTGGGGNSSSPSSSSAPSGAALNPENLDPSTFDTTEGQAQAGVLAMNTIDALARGYNGSIYSRNSDGSLISSTPIGNVKVAVVDTGVDLTQADLAGNILTANSVTCNVTDSTGSCVAGGSDTSTDGHGTFVAGIIAAEMNGVGTYGIAPDAKIMSIGFADPSGNLTGGDVPGIQYALSNGAQVFNGSYAYTGLTPATATPSDIISIVNANYGGTTAAIQYQNGVENHAIFVYAAGNESLTNPDVPAALPYYFQGATAPTGITQANYDLINPSHLDWSKNWVAVVSVTLTGSTWQISSFSNQCGVAAAWCLSAPGNNITSTANGSGDTTGSGTSFAAPQVTGAIADMLGAFPQLAPEKILQILFSTATSLGPASVYGYGMVNLEKATSPSDGGWSLSVVQTGQNFAFTTSGFGLSTPFGNALSSSNLQLQFLDYWGKNYTIPLSTVATSLTPVQTISQRFSSFATPNLDNVVHLGDTAQLGFSSAQQSEDIDHPNTNTFGKFSYQSSTPAGWNGQATTFFALNYQTNLADVFSDMSQKKLSVSNALKNPYLNLIDAANSSLVGVASGPSKISMAVYSGQFQDEYDYRFDEGRDVDGVYLEYKYTGDDNKSNITIDDGVSIEQQGFLGSETSGAFAINKSSTYYTGISGEYALSDHLSLVGNYHMGVTKVSASSESIFTGFDNITTNAFALGTEYTGIQNADDRLSFIISQPLRVNAGGASLTLPTGVTDTDNMLYSSGRLNLAPTGREMDIETNYSVRLDGNSDLSLNAIYRSDPDNSTSPGSEAIMLGKYSFSF